MVEGLQERYQFTWPDKKKAMLAANAPINKTLRPCREESVDFDNTENLYIEGDNLEVLKLLQETYLGKVKMIYIDPPYNTGNDFVYKDEFGQNTEEYLANSGQYNPLGNRMVQNLESNGRFHTDWLNMMYPRLKLAKDLLSDDGVIFISIDDNEQDNLKKVCEEIFGHENFISNSIRRTINSGKHDVTTIAPFHEYILMYSKSFSKVRLAKKPKDQTERDRLYKEVDEYENTRGRFYITQLNKNSLQYSDGLNYPIKGPDGVDIWPGNGFEDKVWIWRWSKQKVLWGIENGFIVFKKSGGKYKVYTKSYEFVDKDGNPINRDNPYSTLEFIAKEYANFNATPELEKLFDRKKCFDFPKSLLFIKELIKMANLNEEGIILDFFSGSATTAHAVMQLNAEDGGHRKFIMVQLPEACDEKSEAYKAGYKNICEIGKERIRRAGQKIKDENPLTTQDLDIGFRVLKLDSSNMEDVYYTPKEYMDKEISLFVDNVKSDRSSEDLLFQVMLDLGTSLSSKIVKKEIAGKEVFDVANGHIMACFDKDVNDDVITAIAKEKPSYFVMRDNSLAGDSVAINFEQIFNTYSPNTERRVI
ncbi:MAG: site-specific DNA-methyltransferase [Elusimicrobiales bacterium]|nr:site-specific DNA-methyltransferase [Elusimicrobiales bacterium]